MDRRNSKDAAPPRPPRQSPDVVDDVDGDVDEDDFMPSVSDGFRPGHTRPDASDGERQNHDRNDPPRPQISHAKSADSTDLRRVATRNSTAKAPLDQDATPADVRPLHSRRPAAQSSSLQHRVSVSSTASFATTTRPESPLGHGPSHPYGMYPQNTMARSSSIATTSTSQHTRQSMSLQRPTHPYGMYTQNVIEDDEPVPVPAVQTAIPVGFPGTAAGYRRQIGPDGEEQDIIGLDGHTEQLPPYSRYPEEGPTKASIAAEASASNVAANPQAVSDASLPSNDAPPSPVSPVSPVTPLAPIDPARLPPRRPETQTGEVANPRPATSSESASLLTNEESVPEKEDAKSLKRQHWRDRRLWGKVPITVALVLLILLLVFAISLGAAIGTYFAKQGKKHRGDKDKWEAPASQVSPSNTLFDATPITTAVSIAPLPTGEYFLPLGSAQESSPGCLTQGNQYAAWSCRMSFAPLVLTVTGVDPPVANVKAFTAPDGAIQYGLQPPIVYNQTMQLVTDLDFKAYGPAWHFAGRYDKIVILTPEDFIAGQSIRRRQNKPYRHRFQVQPGDIPWVCFWNGTYIEGYIYATDNSSAAVQSSGLPTPNPTDPFGSAQTTDSTAPKATSVPAPPPPPPPPAPAPTSIQKRDDSSSPPPYPRLQPYPRIVKLEERRVPGAAQPLCQKMQLLENGQLAVVTSPSGGILVVELQEQDPDPSVWNNQGPGDGSFRRSRREALKRGDPSDSCHCQWMFQ